jgi:hypothetical protein
MIRSLRAPCLEIEWAATGQEEEGLAVFISSSNAPSTLLVFCEKPLRRPLNLVRFVHEAEDSRPSAKAEIQKLRSAGL